MIKREICIKVYRKGMIELSQLSKKQNMVLAILLDNSARINPEQEICISKQLKTSIAHILNISVKYVNEIIRNLVKKHVLIPKEYELYVFNPFMIGVTAWSDVNKLRNKYPDYMPAETMELPYGFYFDPTEEEYIENEKRINGEYYDS